MILQPGVARHLGQTDPVRGAEMAPGNAMLSAEAARALAHGEDGDPGLASTFARSALARDATLTKVIEVLALREQENGRMSQAQRLFSLSSRISRRSLATRVWFIERAVEQGKAQAALAQMEIALRTSTAAPSMIFPALRNGLTDPDLVEPIARLVDRPSDWRDAFLFDVAGEAEPESAAALLLALHDRAPVEEMGYDDILVGRLVDKQQFRLAREVVSSYGRGQVSGRLVDGDFSNTAHVFPFGWGLVESGIIGATVSRGSESAVLSYHADEGKFGQVAAQLLMLPEGRYRLSSVSDSIGDPLPFWHLACGDAGGSKLAQMSAAKGHDSRTTREFAIPAGCEAQWLTLHLRPSVDGNQSGTIARVAIVRS